MKRPIVILAAVGVALTLACGGQRVITQESPLPSPQATTLDPVLANQLSNPAVRPLGVPQQSVPTVNGSTPGISAALATITEAWKEYLPQANNAHTPNLPHFVRTYEFTDQATLNTVCANQNNPIPGAMYVCEAGDYNNNGPTQTHVLVEWAGFNSQFDGQPPLVGQVIAALAYPYALRGEVGDMARGGIEWPATSTFDDCITGMSLRTVAHGVSRAAIQAALVAAQSFLRLPNPNDQALDFSGYPVNMDALMTGYSSGRLEQCPTTS